MNRIKVLIKYYVKDALYEMFSSTKVKKPVMLLLLLLIIGCISMPLGIMVGSSYDVLNSIGQGGMIIAFILFLGRSKSVV